MLYPFWINPYHAVPLIDNTDIQMVQRILLNLRDSWPMFYNVVLGHLPVCAVQFKTFVIKGKFKDLLFKNPFYFWGEGGSTVWRLKYHMRW